MTRTPSTLIALLTGVLAFAFVGAPTVRAADEKDTPLAKAMDELGDAYKALKKSVKDPAKNAESLKLVEKAQHATLVSKANLPKMMAKVPAADKPKLEAGYKKMMTQVMVALCKLEEQLIDGKNEEAVESLKALHELEEKGHEVYNAE